MFERVAVIGTGLIGGSVALAARALPGVSITGYDVRPEAVAEGVTGGILDEVASDIHAAVAGADLVVLALPVDLIPEAIATIAPGVAANTTVTDVGSAKQAVVAAGEAALGGRFVGGHPMAGSERHGIAAAGRDLFRGAPWILTPTATTAAHSFQVVRHLVTVAGAQPVAVAPETHDRLVASLSHLPQLAASALVRVAGAGADEEALLALAAAGFRDVTRIAASDPDMWIAILRSNREAVLEALDGFGAALADMRRMLEAERWAELRAELAAARAARLGVFAKRVPAGPPVALNMVVPDRPGVLAEVTTAAGRLGVNIEDLRIVHSTQGGSGRLELIVSGGPGVESLRAALGDLGYAAEPGGVE